MENGNNQATSDLPPVPATGNKEAELQARIAELEKQSEGRLRDLQSERQKRQELEASVPKAPVANAEVTTDELGKVINPYIEARVKPLMAKVKDAEAFVANTYKEKALEHLATKVGKSKEAIIQDKDLDDKLSGIVKRYGLVGNVYDVTVRAVDIMELENLRASESERKRAAAAASGGSLPSGTHQPVAASGKEFSEEDFSSLPMVEYEKLANEGTFAQNKEGKIVFTPNPK